jgi:hypothetical protein
MDAFANFLGSSWWGGWMIGIGLGHSAAKGALIAIAVSLGAYLCISLGWHWGAATIAWIRDSKVWPQ